MKKVKEYKYGTIILKSCLCNEEDIDEQSLNYPFD